MLLPSQPQSKCVWRTKQELGNAGNSQRAADLHNTLHCCPGSLPAVSHPHRALVGIIQWAVCGGLWVLCGMGTAHKGMQPHSCALAAAGLSAGSWRSQHNQCGAHGCGQEERLNSNLY